MRKRIQRKKVPKNILSYLSADDFLKKSYISLSALVVSKKESFFIFDKKLKIVKANNLFYKTFNVIPEEVEQTFLYKLKNEEWRNSVFQKALKKLTNQNISLQGLDMSFDITSVDRRIMMVQAERVYTSIIQSKTSPLFILHMQDITSLMAIAQKVANQEAQKQVKKGEKIKELEFKISTLEKELGSVKRVQRKI